MPDFVSFAVGATLKMALFTFPPAFIALKLSNKLEWLKNLGIALIAAPVVFGLSCFAQVLAAVVQ